MPSITFDKPNVADPLIGRHPGSLPQTAAVSSPLQRLVDRPGRQWRGCQPRAGRRGVAERQASSLYELAGLVAGRAALPRQVDRRRVDGAGTSGR